MKLISNKKEPLTSGAITLSHSTTQDDIYRLNELMQRKLQSHKIIEVNVVKFKLLRDIS